MRTKAEFELFLCTRVGRPDDLLDLIQATTSMQTIYMVVEGSIGERIEAERRMSVCKPRGSNINPDISQEEGEQLSKSITGLFIALIDIQTILSSA